MEKASCSVSMAWCPWPDLLPTCRSPACRFLGYYPSHSQGVAFIIIVTSCNALAYNMIHS